jgi:hypothetical protein
MKATTFVAIALITGITLSAPSHASAQDTRAMDQAPDNWFPWKDPKNPNVIVLNAEDKDAITTGACTSWGSE